MQHVGVVQAECVPPACIQRELGVRTRCQRSFSAPEVSGEAWMGKEGSDARVSGELFVREVK